MKDWDQESDGDWCYCFGIICPMRIHSEISFLLSFQKIQVYRVCSGGSNTVTVNLSVKAYGENVIWPLLAWVRTWSQQVFYQKMWVEFSLMWRGGDSPGFGRGLKKFVIFGTRITRKKDSLNGKAVVFYRAVFSFQRRTLWLGNICNAKTLELDCEVMPDTKSVMSFHQHSASSICTAYVVAASPPLHQHW